ncbi:MAG: RNA pyrophosphohydrolase [Alphaproteobacteria bacterium]|nr:RNA pyrophosphohydrolase [Alphaproteobacteria bacterium]
MKTVTLADYRPGVGLMLFDRKGRVFVARRNDTPDAWQMPQGGIDDGEDPRAAALRELAEETGVTNAEIVGESEDWIAYDLPEELRKKVWKGRYRGQRQKWYALRHLGKDSDIDLNAHEAEFDAWRWAALDELESLIVPFKRDLYRRVVAELGPIVRKAVAP